MKRRISVLVLLFALIFSAGLGFGAAAHAVDPAVPQGFGDTLLPSVSVSKLSLSLHSAKPGDTVGGTFVLVNHSPVAVPDVSYRVSLAGDYQDSLVGSIYDSKVFGPMYLSAHSSKEVSFSYQLPQGFGGPDLGIHIEAFLSSGLPLGWDDASLAVSGNSTSVSFVNVSLSGDNSPFDPLAGPTVRDSASLSLTLSNPTSGSLTLRPRVRIYRRSLAKDTLYDQDGQAVSIASGGSVPVSVALPLFEGNPGVYLGTISFVDGSGAQRSPLQDFRYIVGGDIVTIDSATIDHQSVSQGDPVTLSISYGGTPYDIVTDETHVVTGATISAQVYNEKGETVGSVSEQSDFDSSGVKKLAWSALADAKAMRAEITVVKGGKTLASYYVPLSGSFDEAVQQASDSSAAFMNMVIMLVGIIAALLAIFAFIVHRVQRGPKPPMGPVRRRIASVAVLVALGSGALLLSHPTEAAKAAKLAAPNCSASQTTGTSQDTFTFSADGGYAKYKWTPAFLKQFDTDTISFKFAEVANNATAGTFKLKVSGSNDGKKWSAVGDCPAVTVTVVSHATPPPPPPPPDNGSGDVQTGGFIVTEQGNDIQNCNNKTCAKRNEKDVWKRDFIPEVTISSPADAIQPGQPFDIAGTVFARSCANAPDALVYNLTYDGQTYTSADFGKKKGGHGFIARNGDFAFTGFTAPMTPGTYRFDLEVDNLSAPQGLNKKNVTSAGLTGKAANVRARRGYVIGYMEFTVAGNPSSCVDPKVPSDADPTQCICPADMSTDPVTGECVVDACSNIDGIQTQVPAGYVPDVNGTCTPDPGNADMCYNLPGIDYTVPDGYYQDLQEVYPGDFENVCIPQQPCDPALDNGWSCTDWGECDPASGLRSRSCDLDAQCDPSLAGDKPDETLSCDQDADVFAADIDTWFPGSSKVSVGSSCTFQWNVTAWKDKTGGISCSIEGGPAGNKLGQKSAGTFTSKPLKQDTSFIVACGRAGQKTKATKTVLCSISTAPVYNEH